MNLQTVQAVQWGRRCTIGPILSDQGTAMVSNTTVEENVTLSPRRNPHLHIPKKQIAQEVGGSPTDALECSYESPDKDPDTGFQMRETEKLFLWSGAPDSLEAPSATDSSGRDVTKQAASPSDALMDSLGDEGLRSAMRPPAFASQHDWLRHLLLQTIEDAQLLFSSLWDECSCSTLGLPRRTSPSTQSSCELDPAIAFAACGPSAPKRRLGNRGGEASPETCHSSTVSVSTNHGSQTVSQGQTQTEGAKDAEPNDSEAAVAEQQKNTRKSHSRPTAREYISAAMSWATKQLDDPHLFPPSPTASASGDTDLKRRNSSDEALKSTASLIVRRLLRCYSHVYMWHLPLLKQHGAVGHANRCLKRLMFLSVDAQLLDGDEGPLQPIRILADAWLRHDGTSLSDCRSQDCELQPDAASSQAQDASGDWLVPALEKAEKCLGVLDAEEYPFFGTQETPDL